MLEHRSLLRLGAVPILAMPDALKCEWGGSGRLHGMPNTEVSVVDGLGSGLRLQSPRLGGLQIPVGGTVETFACSFRTILLPIGVVKMVRKYSHISAVNHFCAVDVRLTNWLPR